MSTLEQILVGIIIAIVGSLAGVIFGSKGKVDCQTCIERRAACVNLINEKFESMREILEKIWKKLEDSNLMLL